MIIINTGNGKGKTTSAIGQIIRALGHNQKVCLIQLFKGREFYGEQKVLKKLKNLDLFSFAPQHPLCFKNIDSERVKDQCKKALEFFEKLAKSKKYYDLVVLDEFNIAIRDNLIELRVLLEIIDKFDPKINILITGRNAPKELIDKAHLVSEITEIKHPFTKGIKAKKGIEF